ncbi:predicted protein [Streptomyces viridochromogenes DSM 40736]|uniref:Predicted protein n=1 Tax=Streptomyces viridochromogenes (strain DSM 40736 / JCM 4977 / BCRC 1201 / Tue 494) TaxID=591159 RepID=D9XHV0_STRVT|nr:hypothetical protein [Streptomyces viridochromogenes]EFL37129.1 predicted protein [Streptomyces viridochromogenes DSM 40736]
MLVSPELASVLASIIKRLRDANGGKIQHACIRCPVLQMDPRQRPRLLEIIQNLHERNS